MCTTWCRLQVSFFESFFIKVVGFLCSVLNYVLLLLLFGIKLPLMCVYVSECVNICVVCKQFILYLKYLMICAYNRCVHLMAWLRSGVRTFAYTVGSANSCHSLIRLNVSRTNDSDTPVNEMPWFKYRTTWLSAHNFYHVLTHVFLMSAPTILFTFFR